MYTLNTKINNQLITWLITMFCIVSIMIIVGGLTRLTDSGLSIIEWELFTGILPPLSNEEWKLYFEKYQTIPQYKILNYDMSLGEFKIIYYWEYFHRLLARLIGLFILIPLIFFYLSNIIKKEYLKNGCIVFILVAIQGFIGWYMVKSGLVNDTTVSHYRLSIHLTIAFVIISVIFWLLKNVLNDQKKIFFKFSKSYLPYQILILFIFIQIIMGAFVSGLNAGLIYQTWPMMEESYFPDDLKLHNYMNLLDFNNHSLVQFYHRNLAYFIVIYVSSLAFIIYKNKKKKLYNALIILLFVILLQILLGILTLISGVNMYLASAHQITGVLLIISAINLYYLNVK